MIWKTLILLGLAAFVAGDGHATSEQKVIIRSKPQHGHHDDLKHYSSHKPEHHEEYAWSYPSYEFYYKVDDPHTKDVKGQKENREGDEVKGEYWLIEPDGRKRTVEYYSNKKSGFNAIVKYSGPHKHEHHKEKEYKHKHNVHIEYIHKKDDDHHEEEDHKDEHHDDHHYDLHEKDDHKDDHKDEHKQNDHKDHENNDRDEKRGHSSQIMPYLEQYRPFPNHQASIYYDVPYPQQKYYSRNRKQY